MEIFDCRTAKNKTTYTRKWWNFWPTRNYNDNGPWVIDVWHHLWFTHDVTEETLDECLCEMVKWCIENIGYEVRTDIHHDWYFRTKEDAIAFKMRWS